ncbi:hypothetical protein V6N13_047077 [Hibiscus sabdariffa]
METTRRPFGASRAQLATAVTVLSQEATRCRHVSEAKSSDPGRVPAIGSRLANDHDHLTVEAKVPSLNLI